MRDAWSLTRHAGDEVRKSLERQMEKTENSFNKATKETESVNCPT